MTLHNALVGVVVYAHAVRQAYTLIGDGQRVEMVVSHKHALAAAKLHHFGEKFAFHGFGVSEIVVFFLHETAMIGRFARLFVALLPTFLMMIMSTSSLIKLYSPITWLIAPP